MTVSPSEDGVYRWSGKVYSQTMTVCEDTLIHQIFGCVNDSFDRRLPKMSANNAGPIGVLIGLIAWVRNVRTGQALLTRQVNFFDINAVSARPSLARPVMTTGPDIWLLSFTSRTTERVPSGGFRASRTNHLPTGPVALMNGFKQREYVEKVA
jgi:hypothetical protein